MRRALAFGAAALALLAAGPVLAHGVADRDVVFIESAAGLQIGPYLYLGAKHMVTGYDHLLFLLGVIFFLHRLRDVALYVTMFSLGHSATLLLGVLGGLRVDPHVVDAIIGLSVVYKALDNLGAWRTWLGVQPDNRLMVLLFGLAHGFGLSTKLQDFAIDRGGLLGNMLAFNVGVELGQLLALALLLTLIVGWRRSPRFEAQAVAANLLMIGAGFVLFQSQLAGALIEGGR